MNPNTFVPSFYFYKLADAISSPYTSLMAYQAGNIDANGNITNSISSIDPFEYLVIKLKQIFDQLPYGITKAKLSNYMTTLQMFGEEVEKYEISQEQFHCLVEGIVSQNTHTEDSDLELLEDKATGGGAGAIGVPAEGGNINQGGVSGFDPRMGLPIMRRKKEQYFDNCEIFDVCPEEYSSFKNAKSWKDVPESETKNYLRRFQRRNRNAKIGVKGLNPLNGETELYWITYPAKNFMEEVDLGDLNFLFEDQSTTKTNKKSNVEREQLAYSAMIKHLTSKGFVHRPDAKADELKENEFNIFKPAQGTADILVGHKLSGKFGLSKIETKYQRHDPDRESSTFDVGVPRSTVLDKSGRKARAWSFVRLFGEPSKTRKYLRNQSEEIKTAIPDILKQKGGIMLVGNHAKVHITNNEDEGSEQHKHDSALLGHLGLKTTHTRHDLNKSGNPYIGNIGSKQRGRTGLLRLSAPLFVMRDNKKYDTSEDQMHNASILNIENI